MAITEKYANFNLTTGSNDGTSEANAWKTPADIVEAAGERVNVKDGARYTIATQWDITANGSATQPIMIRGYTTTIADGGKCKVGGSIDSHISVSGKYIYFENFDDLHTGTQWQHSVVYNSNQGYIKNCKLVKSTTGLMSTIVLSSNSSVINCYIEGRGSNASANVIFNCSGVVKDTIVRSVNGQRGMDVVGSYNSPSAMNILVYSDASTTLSGIKVTGLVNSNGFSMRGFTIDGFDDGLLFDTLPTARGYWGSCASGIISGAVDGISTNEATTRTGIALSDIAFYNNTNDDSAMGDNGVNNKISCTADPYEDSANGDFRPNTTAGGGALLQAQSGFGAGVVTSGRDIGALQHADPAGGGGGAGVNKLVGSGGLVG